MRRRYLVPLTAVFLGALTTGCAKFPATGGGGTPRMLIDMRMTLRGAVDENAYYLFVIDTSGRDAKGPVIIAPYTQYTGNGRATGAYTHYVEYHLGRFDVFKDQPEEAGVTPPARTVIGQPFRSDSTSSTGVLRCWIDQDQLKLTAGQADLTQISLNLITVNEIVTAGSLPPVPRQTDGLGTDGNTFLVIRLQNGTIIENNGIESTGETFEGKSLSAEYDIADFRVAVVSGS